MIVNAIQIDVVTYFLGVTNRNKQTYILNKCKIQNPNLAVNWNLVYPD